MMSPHEIAGTLNSAPILAEEGKILSISLRFKALFIAFLLEASEQCIIYYNIQDTVLGKKYVVLWLTRLITSKLPFPTSAASTQH